MTLDFTNHLALSIAAAAPSDAVAVQSVWDFVRKGGPMMIPIGICSLIALAVFIERLIVLRRRNVIPPRFLPGLKVALDTSRDQAIAYCSRNQSPVARVFAAGLRRQGASVEQVERHISEAGEREVVKLRRNMRVLQVIAAIAPLMGLLGTIFGMILAFQTVASDPDALGKTEKLAQGIYQAMITTAAGLIVAIPVIVFYHFLSARIDRLVAEIDHMTVEFVEDVADPAQRAGRAARTQADALARPGRDVKRVEETGIGVPSPSGVART